MRHSPLLQLTRPGAGFSHVLQTYDGVDLILKTFDNFHDRDASYCITFSRAISFSVTDELTSAGFLEDAYETLLEVHDSPQLEKVMNRTRHRDSIKIREFCIFIENYGASTIFSCDVSWLA